MKIIQAFLGLLLCQLHVYCQDLIPYLGANGKYGYATENGKVILEPIFDGLAPMSSKEIATVAIHNGQSITLVRNGMKLPSEFKFSIIPVENYPLGNDEVCLDSFNNLSIFYDKDTILFVNLNSKATYKSIFKDRLKNPTWFTESFWSYYNFAQRWRFRQGIFKVYKALDKINFIDTALNEVFDRDFAAATMVDDNYFVVAEGSGRLAIADRTGKIRTPFMWDAILPSSRTGYFIVNSPMDIVKSPGTAGLIDSDGKIIIDTIYSFIQPVNGGKVLIVRDQDKVGLMDYNGRIIMPLEVNELTPNQLGNRMVAIWEGPRANIIDIYGRKILPSNVQSISLISRNCLELFKVTNPNRQTIVDTSGVVVFEDTLCDISVINFDPLQFKVQKNVLGEKKIGVLNASGELIIDEIYDEIIPSFQNWCYLVTKDSLKGMIDTSGKVVMEVKYEEFMYGSDSKDMPYIWGKENGEKLWVAYDNQMNRQPISPCFWPGMDNNVFGIGQFSGRDYKIILFDGTLVPVPPDFPKFSSKKDYLTPEGGFVLFTEKGTNKFNISKVYNHQLKNIIPKDFFVSKRLEDENQIQNNGLLVLYKNSLDSGNVEISPNGLALPTIPSVQDVVNENSSCGIMNALGEWVMPPKQGVRYIAMSHDIIAEVLYNEQFKAKKVSIENPIKIHLLTQSEKSVNVVNYVHSMYFSYNMTTTMFGVWNEKNKRLLKAYFDKHGNQLTPFNVIDGPDNLFVRNLVFILGQDGKKHQVILGNDGKVVKDMKNWWSIEPISDKPLNWSLDYLVVYNSNVLPEIYQSKILNKNDILKMSKELDFRLRLVDSIGNWVLPDSFKQMEIVKPGSLIWVENEKGNAQLLSWKGAILHTFDVNQILTHNVLSDGTVLVADEHETIVVSTEGAVVKTIPIAYSKENKESVFENKYFYAKDAEGKNCWASIKDGNIYKEE